jgi:hypothetical protein
MLKQRIGALLAAFVVLAFAAPAWAGASQLTSSAGKLTPVGTAVTLTGTSVVFQSSTWGKWECARLTLSGTVTKNSSAEIEASANNTNPPTENCRLGARSAIITSFNLTKLFSSGTGHSGTASFVAKIDIGAELVCTTTGTNVPFTYTAGGSSIVFKEGAGVAGGACGTSKLSGTFLLETAAGGALTID